MCDLYVGGALIAWFYLARAPGADVALRFEEGIQGLWMGVEEALRHEKMSPWHRPVLAAWQRGQKEVHLDR